MALYLGTVGARPVLPYAPDLDDVKQRTLEIAGDTDAEILVEIWPDPDAVGPCPITGLRYDRDVKSWVRTA